MSQAKKGAARGKKAGKGHADDKGEEVLQAVVCDDDDNDEYLQYQDTDL